MKNRGLEPFYFEDPWSKRLAGKTVLIIHNFISSIKCQLKRSAALFPDRPVLPSFRAKFVHMPQCLGKKRPHGSWIETLDAVKRMVDRAAPFDVAIIAAGSYAIPLAVHCKGVLSASSIIMGGGSQLLFGLKGRRWDSHDVLSGLYNKNWMYPLEEDTPSNANSIEAGGPYWGNKHQRLTRCPITV